jgi:hypothetical protein
MFFILPNPLGYWGASNQSLPETPKRPTSPSESVCQLIWCAIAGVLSLGYSGRGLSNDN